MVTVTDDWVEFLFYCPSAERVHLAGDFNNWQPTELAMRRCDDGYWKAQMKLPSGEFRFRYNADGAWFTDYAAFGVEPGRFGFDSIVRVPPRTLRVVEPAAPATGIAAA